MSDNAADPGQERNDQAASAGEAGAEAICSTCDGTGQADGEQCSTCGGSGKVIEPVGGA